MPLKKWVKKKFARKYDAKEMNKHYLLLKKKSVKSVTRLANRKLQNCPCVIYERILKFAMTIFIISSIAISYPVFDFLSEITKATPATNAITPP